MNYQARRGRFEGFRVNCECVPCLPARVVADCLADPREIPYLLIWTQRPLSIQRDSLAAVLLAEPREAVRLSRPTRNEERAEDSPGYVEVKRWTGCQVALRLAQYRVPRGGTTLLLCCDWCLKPRRVLYGREVIKAARYVRPADWICRTCAKLSYASEGQGLIFRTRWAPAKRLSGLQLGARPQRWEPRVFASPVDAFDLGYVENLYRETLDFTAAKEEPLN